jgi:hypothetical protein
VTEGVSVNGEVAPDSTQKTTVTLSNPRPLSALVAAMPEGSLSVQYSFETGNLRYIRVLDPSGKTVFNDLLRL